MSHSRKPQSTQPPTHTQSKTKLIKSWKTKTKNKTSKNKKQNKNKLPLPYLWRKSLNFAAVKQLLSWQLFLFIKKAQSNAKCTYMLQTKTVFFFPPNHISFGVTLTIHIYLMCKSKQPYVYNCLQSTEWYRKWSIATVHRHMQTTITLSSRKANIALMLQHAVLLRCKKMQLLADKWQRWCSTIWHHTDD